MVLQPTTHSTGRYLDDMMGGPGGDEGGFGNDEDDFFADNR